MLFEKKMFARRISSNGEGVFFLLATIGGDA